MAPPSGLAYGAEMAWEWRSAGVRQRSRGWPAAAEPVTSLSHPDTASHPLSDVIPGCTGSAERNQGGSQGKEETGMRRPGKKTLPLTLLAIRRRCDAALRQHAVH